MIVRRVVNVRKYGNPNSGVVRRIVKKTTKTSNRGLDNKQLTDYSNLVSSLKTLLEYECPRDVETCGELFIHWYYPPRKKDELMGIEKFHLNMLKYFNFVNRMDKIHIRCAYNGEMTGAIKQAIDILSGYNAEIELKIVKPKDDWERDTFVESVNYALDTDKRIYYVHFKGTGNRYKNGVYHDDYHITELGFLNWSFCMYDALATAPSDAKFIGPIKYPNRKIDLGPSEQFDKYVAHFNVRNVDFFAGSFQMYDGRELKKYITDRNVFDNVFKGKPNRDRCLVEIFLTLAVPSDKVYFKYIAHNPQTHPIVIPDYATSLLGVKLAVIKYMVGDYEKMYDDEHFENDVEYLCISDKKIDVTGKWKLIVDEELNKKYSYAFDKTSSMRYNPFKYTNAEYVICMDASQKITGPLNNVIWHMKSGGYDLATIIHPEVYDFKIECSRWEKNRKLPHIATEKFMSYLNETGYDFSYKSLIQTNFVVYHKTDEVVEFLKDVLDMIFNKIGYDGHSHRVCQCGFSYLLNTKYNNIKTLPLSYDNCRSKSLKRHHHNSDVECSSSNFKYMDSGYFRNENVKLVKVY